MKKHGLDIPGNRKRGVGEEDDVTKVCLDKATPDVYTSMGYHHYNSFSVSGIFETHQKLQKTHQRRLLS